MIKTELIVFIIASESFMNIALAVFLNNRYCNHRATFVEARYIKDKAIENKVKTFF
jgi:hypothetical protein